MLKKTFSIIKHVCILESGTYLFGEKIYSICLDSKVFALPTPRELHTALPLGPAEKAFIDKSREEIQKILLGKDLRLLLIIGPCSIHDLDACLEYAEKLKGLADRVGSSCFIAMRAYMEKPRTRDGWKGLIHDPHLDESYDIEEGLLKARSFLLKLAQMRMPAATEFVTPPLAPYFADLISWGCIGARTSSSQPHRHLAAYLPMPIGFKNSVDGNIDCAIHSAIVARSPHPFVHIDDDGRLCRTLAPGNPAAHVVLRGSQHQPNYDAETVAAVLTKLRRFELPPRIIIDCAHDNSRKRSDKQLEVFQNVLEQIAAGNKHICGVMLESHLEAGVQPVKASGLQRGVSITDPCIDFSTVESALISSSICMRLTHI